MRIIIIFFIFSLTYSQDSEIRKFVLNNELSKIIWRANKPGSFHNGFIDLKNGYINIKQHNSASDIEIEGGNIVIDMSSISCHDILKEASNNSLVQHLKSDDFFSTDIFPTANLIILEATKQRDRENDIFLIRGDLTILNKTHPIEFFASCKFWDNMENMNSKDSISGFKAEGVIPINRAIYGVKYSSKTWYENLGDHFIDDVFYLYFNITTYVP